MRIKYYQLAKDEEPPEEFWVVRDVGGEPSEYTFYVPEDENAKLRKLVCDFDKCLTEAVRLAYIQGHATIYDSTLLDSLHPRMRELGIESDN